MLTTLPVASWVAPSPNLALPSPLSSQPKLVVGPNHGKRRRICAMLRMDSSSRLSVKPRFWQLWGASVLTSGDLYTYIHIYIIYICLYAQRCIEAYVWYKDSLRNHIQNQPSLAGNMLCPKPTLLQWSSIYACTPWGFGALWRGARHRASSAGAMGSEPFAVELQNSASSSLQTISSM